MPYRFDHTPHQLTRALDNIFDAITTRLVELHVDAWVTPEPVPFTERESGDLRVLTLGDTWGQLWDCAWMHLTGTVPQAAAGHPVVLLVDVSGEAHVVDEDGTPVLGLTTRASSFDFAIGRAAKRVVPLLDAAQGGETVDIWIEAGNNDLFGRFQNDGKLEEAHIAIFHPALFDLYHDFRVLHTLLGELPPERARTHQIRAALHKAAQCLHDYTPAEAEQARAILAPELAKTGGTPSLRVTAIGHAHIDLAWLWPIRETIRKGGRTFATVLALMEQYPDYVFGASQPQLYQWMKDRYPTLYARIKQQVAAGRWEAQGAMWVEPDTNLPGGESLIRQILYGKRFFREEFGIEPRTLWLPDVFGYSAALPQILTKSGVDYFLTIKISWNTFNFFPHHTFWWQGIDGSRVLAHMPPEGNYNSNALPSALMKSERLFADKAVSDEIMLLYGIGDGGGGPGVEHLEALARERDLDGLPPVTQGFAEPFFERIAEHADAYKTWIGELYLEKHQGTYTTQARNKRYNRKLELALRELELWGALGGQPAPKAELDAVWQEMLLFQFHDILPGSSITRVYDESLARYAVLMEQVGGWLNTARQALVPQIDTSAHADPVVVANSLSWRRREWVKFGEAWQHVTVPPMGYTVLDTAAEQPDIPAVSATPTTLTNDLLRVTFDADSGAITAIIDEEHDREVLSGPGNRLAVYHDPGDAWDFEYGYRDELAGHFALESSEALVDGPQAILAQRYRFGASVLEQRIVLTAGSRRLDFITTVDWQETHKMLRTSFPVTVSAPQVTCNIQFGAYQRPTHQNTAWDMARHEICAHKWLDLSQPNYGVALLNDCKYGHYVEGSLLDLNLLRSPTGPDPVADRARHEFTYALYPHIGEHITGKVFQAGYELNVPLQVLPTAPHPGDLPAEHSFLAVNTPAVIIETIKPAEDGEGLIVRLYEAHGAHEDARLTFGFPVARVQETDMLENPLRDMTHDAQAVALTFAPYEIRTLRVIPA